MSLFRNILGILVALLTITDWLSNHWTGLKERIGILTEPIFEVSVLRILILILVIGFLYIVLPLEKTILKSRANKFYKNWIDFKNIIEEYSKNKDIELQRKFNSLRKSLVEDFHFFNKRILNLQSQGHRSENISRVLWNFEQCITVRNIGDWESEVKRAIPREIDCFDYLLISLKENI